MDQNEFFIKRIRELADMSYQRDIVTFSDFLDLNQQNMVNSQRTHLPGVVIETSGGYEQAERQMVAFHPDALAFTWEYPITCIKIEPRSAKFGESLTHRDYLGALLNLGIDRAVLGDILIQEKTAWIFCEDKIAKFLCDNLFKVRHTEVELTVIDHPSLLPKPNLKEIRGTVASVRLDSLISTAFNASRSSMVPYIEGAKVFVNGKLVTSNGYEPKEGDIISVRGKGRFRFEGVGGKTKKGKTSITLQLFC